MNSYTVTHQSCAEEPRVEQLLMYGMLLILSGQDPHPDDARHIEWYERLLVEEGAGELICAMHDSLTTLIFNPR